MTAALILSGMVIAVGKGWIVADRETATLITRQKAVFSADAEMSRLVTIYGTTNFGVAGPKSTTGYSEISAFPSTRLIYPTSVSSYTSDYITTSAGTFNTGSPYQVWVDTSAGSTSVYRSYVWIDKEHNVMGRVSWTATAISPSACVVGSDTCPCLEYGGSLQGSCQKLMLYMEYPYHLVGGSSVADTPLQTITLSTIVGRRAP